MKKESKAKINEEKKISENINKLEKEIQNKKRMPKEKQEDINKKIFENILIAIIVMIYFYLINIGSLNIETNVFLTDLKVFSVGIIIFTIILFEYSYKKENSNVCIHGIESLFISIVTLFSIYAYTLFFDKFNLLIALSAFLFAIYYVGKSIIIYKKMRKSYFKNLSDIGDIIKKKN